MMMDETKRRNDLRLSQYDYRSPGYYYVTFCSHNRECVFGEIYDTRLVLSDFGKMVDAIWRSLPEHFLNISLDWMQIMPNHVHAIIIIEENRRTSSADPNPFAGDPTLGQIVGYWKYQSAKGINECRGILRPVWQKNMFEHVIRNEWELQMIRTYIQNNPGAWFDDIENPINPALLHIAEARRKLGDFLMPDLTRTNPL